jgi:thiol-disulfide isomerase/thioredoxin
MKKKYTFILALFNAVYSFSQVPTLKDVRDKYMAMKSMTLYVESLSSHIYYLDKNTTNMFIKMNREDEKGFNFFYVDSYQRMVLRDSSTKHDVHYYEKIEDSIYVYPVNKKHIKKYCANYRTINLHIINNPFSDCFYHRSKLMNHTYLTDIGSSYFYNLTSNHNGLNKFIWVNKKTLLVDSIEYFLSSGNSKLRFNYISYSNTQFLNLSDTFNVLKTKFQSMTFPTYSSIPDSVEMQFVLGKSNLNILDFWYLGCAPCIAAFPHLQNISDSFNTDELSISVVNYADKIKNINYFKSIMPYTFDYVSDSIGITKKYQVSVFPTTILLDENQNVLLRLEGNSEENFLKLKETIAAELKKRKLR